MINALGNELKKELKAPVATIGLQTFNLSKTSAKQITTTRAPVPIELMERIILLTTEPGDLVIDPFCGSGTTAVACLNTKRRFLGFEIDTVYADMANERMAEHALKLERNTHHVDCHETK